MGIVIREVFNQLTDEQLSLVMSTWYDSSLRQIVEELIEERFNSPEYERDVCNGGKP